MSDTQFISHAQVVPPTLVPRKGLGLFGALAVVLAILSGVLTGALVLLKKSMQDQVANAEKQLVQVRTDTEVDSIAEAQALQSRIEKGYQLLNGHVYASQSFNFVEDNILGVVDLKSFSFAAPKIKVDLTAPGYLEYAQQIRYLRTMQDTHKDIVDFTPSPPTVSKSGKVSFSVDITLSDAYLHSKPGSNAEASTPAPASESTTTPPTHPSL